MNGTEELSEIEILVHRVLDDNGFEPGALEIDSIDERIGQVEAEIMKIISTDPYLYKELLEDPSAVEVRKKELEEEYEAYARYAEELEKTLKQLLMRGVVIECQEN